MTLVKKIHPLKRLWNRYKQFILTTLRAPAGKEPMKLEDWQNGLFAAIVVYALPISLIAVLPSLILEYQMGNWEVVTFNCLAMLIFAALVGIKQLSLQMRKVTTVVMIGLFSLIQILAFGHVTVGFAYLFGLNIFVGFQFRLRHAHLAIGVAFALGLLIAVNQHFGLIYFPALYVVSAEDLVIASSNLLFLNMVIVVLIHKTQESFEQTMSQRTLLYHELQKELADSERLNTRLAESEDHYKMLFSTSPLPKMIVDAATGQLLQVNTAAVNQYGYAAHELLQMTLNQLIAAAPGDSTAPVLNSSASRIRKKDGSFTFAELSSREIQFKGRRAIFVLIVDMTERVNHLTAIKRQNEHLREIAYMQAHVIRSPLTKIMSLTELIALEQKDKDNDVMAEYLKESALELDQAVREIINRSQRVLRESGGEEGPMSSR